MPNAYTLVAEFRLDLLRRDTAAREDLLNAYRRAFNSIEEEIRRVATQIVVGKGSPSLLREQRQLYELQRQVKEAVTRLGERAADIAERNSLDAVTRARAQAIELIEAKVSKLPKIARVEIGATFNQFPADVVRELVTPSLRHPISEVFDELAKELGQITTDRIRHGLERGIVLGESPDQVTRRIIREANALNGNPKRPPVVVRRLHSAVRNETFRAYRRATLRTYQQNDDVVHRWRWVSRQSPTTCVLCWSRDGRTFPLMTPFTSHPNCRCVMVPVIEGESERYVSGIETFDDLEVGVQKDILGARAYQQFANGKLGIEDLVAQTRSRKWGPGLQRLSVDDALRRKLRAA